MKPFSLVIPLRDTDSEYEFMKKTIDSAFRLDPGELILLLDKPASARIMSRAREISQQYNPNILKFITTEKTEDWNFQLAHLLWDAYTVAKYDKILSSDIDTIITSNVSVGLTEVGKNNVAVVSFTKKLRTKTIGEIIRYLFYRIRIRKSSFVFTGIYWIYRPFYFQIISKEKIQKIYNGVDTLLVNEILSQNKYKIITRKEIGGILLTPANEDLPWRQYQVGLWFGANIEKIIESKRKSLDFQRSNKLKKIILKILFKFPLLLIFIKSFVVWRPHMVSGYNWAIKHPNSNEAKIARTMDLNEWNLLGAKYVKHKDWKVKGTGFID